MRHVQSLILKFVIINESSKFRNMYSGGHGYTFLKSCKYTLEIKKLEFCITCQCIGRLLDSTMEGLKTGHSLIK